MILPTLEYEQNLWSSGYTYIAGVDEVGRGCLAGPVVAAAVVFAKIHTPHKNIRDSKTLSKLQKNSLHTVISQSCLEKSIGEASSQEIDELGIVPATALAMQRALEGLQTVDHVLIDGLPFKDTSLLKKHQKTFIVKGDALSYSIAAASILAKVHRDSIMNQYAQLYPQYLFEKNVGYGTLNHRLALQKNGLTPLHRKSFCKNYC